jgi:hypothetical protein
MTDRAALRAAERQPDQRHVAVAEAHQFVQVQFTPSIAFDAHRIYAMDGRRARREVALGLLRP